MGDSSEENNYLIDLQSKYQSLRQQPISGITFKDKSTEASNHTSSRLQSAKLRKSTQNSQQKFSQSSLHYQPYTDTNNKGNYSQVRKYPNKTSVNVTIASPQHQKTTSMKSQQNISKRVSQNGSIDFTPSKSYLYVKKKYEWEVNSKCDRLKMFQRASEHWKSDKFLSSNHQVNANESREGRKLKLAEYNNKFTQKQLIKKKSSNAPQYKLSQYVIPSDMKRDELRYEIRMKMLRSSAISFNRPFSSDGRSKKSKKNAKSSINASFNYKY